jgi:sucrose-6-phosphate hydrolase SacC (GH32 family)
MWCRHFPRVGFTGAELAISWSAQSQELKVKEEGRPEAESYGYYPDGKVPKLSPKNGLVALHILLDIPSVEVVTGGGDYIIKGREYRKLGEKSPVEIRAEGGDVRFSRLEVYPLRSIH